MAYPYIYVKLSKDNEGIVFRNSSGIGYAIPTGTKLTEDAVLNPEAFIARHKLIPQIRFKLVKDKVVPYPLPTCTLTTAEGEKFKGALNKIKSDFSDLKAFCDSETIIEVMSGHLIETGRVNTEEEARLGSMEALVELTRKYQQNALMSLGFDPRSLPSLRSAKAATITVPVNSEETLPEETPDTTEVTKEGTTEA